MKNLIENIDRIHTTPLGEKRIAKNLGVKGDATEYCKKIILKADTEIDREGKNYYCKNGFEEITVNSYSYTIITAHINKRK